MFNTASSPIQYVLPCCRPYGKNFHLNDQLTNKNVFDRRQQAVPKLLKKEGYKPQSWENGILNRLPQDSIISRFWKDRAVLQPHALQMEKIPAM